MRAIAGEAATNFINIRSWLLYYHPVPSLCFDVFLVIISAKECQTDVLTKVGTILLCSFVFNGISHHRHFIFDFFFCTMYPCPDLLLEGVSKQ